MEDLVDIDKCITISELVDTECLVETNVSVGIDEKFDSLYDKVTNNNEGEGFEAIVSINKSNKTAVITPVVRNKHLVDYESSETESEDSLKVEIMRTPHPKVAPKTPRLKKQRNATPHSKKFIRLMRQKAIEEFEETHVEDENINETPISVTPSGIERLEVSDSQKEVTTPTSQLHHVLKLTQAVTTSTPTNPATGGWSLFQEQGADSPLSEIETTESPAQSVDNDPKIESDIVQPKLKSIIVTESRIRIGSQDSSEKPNTSQETGNSTESSVKSKKVKFAEDTVFKPETKVKRVYRKPKRMLTPGPQRPRFCHNPRFQALINRFESQARTPVQTKREKLSETTPPVGEHNMQARAINFKEESSAVEIESHSRESNELFSTCIDTPVEPINNAITTLTANIAGTLQTCLNSVLRTTEDETEIQFKFVITKKKVSVKRIADDCVGVEEKRNKIGTESQTNKENIWTSVARAVKNVFWSDPASLSPLKSFGDNDSTTSSASKRKYEEMSDCEISPLNHKRHKYEGRIRGRPPLKRSKSWGVSGLRTQTVEQSEMNKTILNDDTINQSF
ncbi:unnamed protein product [Parnassius mnemosyne]|uniref:Uncharacterized protein n=1 Tax=Parnassius mnemosyne TaxID=213953 RepID=A0AAV1KJ72_9NEOP